jgi:hypothetical protein
MDSIVYWVLWVLTLVLVGWVITDGLMKPWKLVEWPFLVSGMWLYFYVYMSFDAAYNFSDIISPRALMLGQLVPLLSLAGLIVGWEMAAPRKRIQYPKNQIIQNYRRVWFFGIALIIGGAVGGYSIVGRASQTGGFDFESSSAYYYLLFYIGYPGMALAFWIAASSAAAAKVWLWTINLILFLIFMFPHVSYLRRGPTFPALLLLAIVAPISVSKPPRRSFYITSLMAAACIMLVYLPLRTVMYKEGSWQDAFSQLSLTSAITERGKNITDNEFVNNCYMIKSISDSGRIQYGTGHISLFLHWLPRSIWESKPTLGEGYFNSSLDLFDDIEQSSGLGIRLIGGGAASGGVADSFFQYGWLTPVVWAGLGWFVSRIYWKGLQGGKILWKHSYIAIVCGTHWLISQGFAAAFVPMVIFWIIPFCVLRYCGNIKIRCPRFSMN